jgi:hypothetical protein
MEIATQGPGQNWYTSSDRTRQLIDIHLIKRTLSTLPCFCANESLWNLVDGGF